MVETMIRTALANLNPLAALSQAALEALASSAKMYNLRTGEVLVRQGSEARSFYVLLSGGVRLVEYTDEGKAVSLKVYGAEDFFGLLALSGVFQHYANIEALDETCLLAFPAAQVRELMYDYPELALLVIDLLTAHVQQSHQRIRELAVERTERRLARAILHFYEKFGSIETEGLRINLSLSQKDIADFTGATLETVNRILRKWEGDELIQIARKQIIIVNAKELQNIANATDMYEHVGF